MVSNHELKKIVSRYNCDNCGTRIDPKHYLKCNNKIFCSEECFRRWDERTYQSPLRLIVQESPKSKATI